MIYDHDVHTWRLYNNVDQLKGKYCIIFICIQFRFTLWKKKIEKIESLNLIARRKPFTYKYDIGAICSLSLTHSRATESIMFHWYSLGVSYIRNRKRAYLFVYGVKKKSISRDDDGRVYTCIFYTRRRYTSARFKSFAVFAIRSPYTAAVRFNIILYTMPTQQTSSGQ